MTENEWDKLLKIKTAGFDNSNSDTIRYPYEPTSYDVLERLANEGYIGKGNTLLDYGCGKGRVSLFLSYQTKCNSIGIDFNERLYECAVKNQQEGLVGKRVKFLCEDATSYNVPPEVDRIFFFNPFSLEILKPVLQRIYDSYYDSPRRILLMFYFPSADYISCLMQEDELSFYDTIDCKDLFKGSEEREQIIIFTIGE